MKPSLQVRLSQHLSLTPQLQQSIRLLQLSTLELNQEVEQMLAQNPLLETEEDFETRQEPPRAELQMPAGSGGDEGGGDDGGGADTGAAGSDAGRRRHRHGCEGSV